ncbi:MAG: CDP-alcohol phosphatidyltransferase family protein [Desulfatiglandaceae bacterium]
MYFGFVLVLNTERGKAYIGSRWYYHPNAICIWRVFIGLAGTFLYFVSEQYTLGILLFTISAVLDGVDGLVARKCDLVTQFGEQIDPFCDKLTYLPPMLFFAYEGRLNVETVWLLILIEASGQFLVRYIIKKFTKFSVAANNFGKIKAVLCFFLIIYCAILKDDIKIPDISNQMLQLCIIMSIASIVFKSIPNRYYADILSILNLLCGSIGMILVLNGMYVYTAIAILAGQIFDLFDGRMAEKHGGTKVGPWLDDIADMVSFGLCPATMIFLKGSMSTTAGLVGALYFFAIAFRLWRFLAVDKHDSSLPPGFFKGLPSPAGAMVALGACLFWQKLWIISIVIVFLGLLLISHIRFIHFGRLIIPNLPRIVVIIGGFIIAFILAYVIKFNSAKLLGAFLLISFLIYIIINSKMISSYIKK